MGVIFSIQSWASRLWAALPGSGVGESLGAGSPFTSYTAAAVVYVLIAGVLITFLLMSAFLVINLGLLSKRREDHVGRRDPSDLEVLRSEVWPREPGARAILPAEEERVSELTGRFPPSPVQKVNQQAKKRRKKYPA